MSDTNKSILIVDDVQNMRTLLKQILTDIGFDRFSEAADAKTAIEIFKSAEPDIVFLDINLPDATGLDVLEQMQELNPQANVVVVSANASFFNIKASLEMGAKGFIAKPYFMNKIKDILKKLE